jgi:hypothetical protein
MLSKKKSDDFVNAHTLFTDEHFSRLKQTITPKKPAQIQRNHREMYSSSLPNVF